MQEVLTLAQPQYEITDADRKRQQRIADAWKAYDGELDPPLKPMEGQPDDNTMSNRCQPIVDRGDEFLFGDELQISVEEGAPPEAQALLDATWGIKESRIPLLQDLDMNGAMAGTPFLRIVPCRNGTFRLVVVDPSTIFVKTAPQDCETVLLYCIEYSESEQRNGKPIQIFYREEIARVDPDNDDATGAGDFSDTTWSIQHWSRAGDRGPWTPSGEPISWPYPFPPLFHCKNLPRPNSFWGKPDITPDLIGLNNSLNLTQSNANRVLKIYGQPILWAKGVGESVLDVKPGRFTVLNPHPESAMGAVPITSDLGSALSFAGNLRSDIDEQSGVPGVATGRIADIPRGTISGIALQLMFLPLLKKTFKKRCRYGKLIIDVSKAILVLAGMSDKIGITLGWQNPLPTDTLADLQAALLKRQIGVSERTLLREAGYDPDEEEALNQAAAAQSLVNFTRGQGMPPVPPQAQPEPASPASPFIGRGE